MITKKLVIGVTGGIACGKTTVTDYLQKKAIDIIDADIIAREVVEPGSYALAEIKKHFGEDIVDGDGMLLRRKLRDIIFENKRAKNWLENLLHPLIRDEICKQIKKINSVYGVLVAPLLFENGLENLVNRVLVIDVEPEMQIQRVILRDKITREQAIKIIASQKNRIEKLEKANDIVENTGDKCLLFDRIERLHKLYMSLSNL